MQPFPIRRPIRQVTLKMRAVEIHRLPLGTRAETSRRSLAGRFGTLREHGLLLPLVLPLIPSCMDNDPLKTLVSATGIEPVTV